MFFQLKLNCAKKKEKKRRKRKTEEKDSLNDAEYHLPSIFSEFIVGNHRVYQSRTRYPGSI